MPRLFTGLEVPYDVQTALSLKRGGLHRRALDRSRKLPHHAPLHRRRRQPHGQRGQRRARPAEPFGGVRGAAFDLGIFGGDKPRALYAGVENNEALQRLQAAHERVLRRAGLVPDARKFVPHVSLARLRGTCGDRSG